MESDNGSKTCTEIRVMPQTVRKKNLIIENIDRPLVYFYKAFLSKLLGEKRRGEKKSSKSYL